MVTVKMTVKSGKTRVSSPVFPEVGDGGDGGDGQKPALRGRGHTLQPDVTERLTPQQLKALTALLETGDKAKAARAAKVSRTTLYRWLHTDAAFRAALDEATSAALRAFSRNLVRLAEKAVVALEAALGDDQDIGTRLRAADIVTGRVLMVRDAIDIEERLEALERGLLEDNGYVH